MRPRWEKTPLKIAGEKLNLLLVPWPFEVSQSSFFPVDVPDQKMPDGYRYFSFDPALGRRERAPVTEVLDALLSRAERRKLRIDGVVFPELALEAKQFADVRALLLDRCRLDQQTRFLLCGVGSPASRGRFGENQARFDLILPHNEVFKYRQSKHHRWQLNRPQIEQYGLRKLTPKDSLWWECINLQHRDLSFFACHPLLTFAVLICEDLARPDPVGDLVRSVGPDLVIALLADAPQLSSRWPGRYASVLSEDPGSSVLTFTSLGMAALSRSRGRRSGKNQRARTVALWSQSGQRPTEIRLRGGCQGVLLELGIGTRREYAADGRDDRTLAGDVRLSRIVQL